MKKKLLLVDDVELFLQLEKTFLDRESLSIFTARSGKEALESAKSIKPDLVLLDIYLPDMNGDEVCRVLKNDPQTKDIPVIIISTEGLNTAKERCVEAGCDGFIPKPIQRNIFLAAVEQFLQIPRRRHLRTRICLDCTVHLEGKDHTTITHTLSQNGAFIEMKSTPASGETLNITLSLPSLDYPIICKAVVRWTGRVREDGTPGFGAEFLDLSDDDKQMIQAFIDSRSVYQMP